MIISSAPRGLKLTVLLSEEEVEDIRIVFERANEVLNQGAPWPASAPPEWEATVRKYGTDIMRAVLLRSSPSGRLDAHSTLRHELSLPE